jgi:DNA-binding Lrp family transcriptional regulator
MAAVFGYVFVEVEGRHVSEVLEAVSRIKGVKAAHAVTGRYDVILQVAADEFSQLANSVLVEVRKINGVKSTETALAIPEPRKEL